MSDSQKEEMVQLAGGGTVLRATYEETKSAVMGMDYIELLNFISAARGLVNPSEPWRPGDEHYMELGIIDKEGYIPDDVKMIVIQSVKEKNKGLYWTPPQPQ
jgi:hypothetical protein